MCDICCENEMKKPISCNLCQYSACYKCFSRFMLECTLNPKCMRCDKPWSRKHLVNSFGQYYVSHTYKKKREDVLFDVEKAMLPGTQPIAVRVKHMKQLLVEIDNKQADIFRLRTVITRLEVGVLQSEFEEFLEKRKNLNMQIHNNNEDIRILHARRDRLGQIYMHKSEKKANALVIKCPDENCRGYVNMRKMECELCNVKLCKDCHEPLGKDEPLDAHTCDPNTVQSVNMIAKDTRNCPSCKSMIHKIDGCDQMFCTQCHTAFSWRTGEVSKGRIHNPHYYEYLRKNGREMREIGDMPCGGLPRATREIVCNKMYSKVHQVASHFELDEIFRLRADCNRYEGNEDLRVMYLNNEIDLVGFKREIYRREKTLDKKREIIAVLTTFVVVCSDIFRNILGDKAAFADEKSTMEQFDNIRDFTNDSMSDVSRVYNCVVPVIGYNWEYGRTKVPK